MTNLKYNGNGEWLNGIPARDLSDNEVTQIASDLFISTDDLIRLLTSRGLYSVVAASKPKRNLKTDDIPEPIDEETDDGS
jgi:hypothetical protein